MDEKNYISPVRDSDHSICRLCGHLQEPSREMENECLFSTSPVFNFQSSAIPLQSGPSYIRADLNDLLEYVYEDEGQMEQSLFVTNNRFLAKTIDTYLIRYFWAVGVSYENEDHFKELPPSIEIKLDKQRQLNVASRKPLIIPPVRKLDGRYGYYQFAFPAKVDLLSKRLFTYKGATKRLLDMGTFFSTEFFKHRQRFKKEQYPSNLPRFKLEDYIYYELQTRCSFAIEICSALLEIEEPDRKIYQKVLTNFYGTFIAEPGIFSRIFLARQCIREARLALECIQYNPEYIRDIIDFYSHAKEEEKNDRSEKWKEKIINETFRSVLQKENIAPSFGRPCNASSDLLETCSAKLSTLLSCIKSPIDIIAYIENPLYGPIAFCNPKHPHAKEILNDLADINAHPDKVQSLTDTKNGPWHDLFEAIYQEIDQAVPQAETFMVDRS